METSSSSPIPPVPETQEILPPSRPGALVTENTTKDLAPETPPSNSKKKVLIGLLAAILIFLLLGAVSAYFLVFKNRPTPTPSPTPTEAAAESTPEPTNTQLPIISSPAAGSTISSPVIITGTVPAGWMFEGSFPIKILDNNKKEIATGVGKEKVPGSWTNGEPTEFSSTITFTTSAASGFIVLVKDNPSGAAENDKSYEIPVKFK